MSKVYILDTNILIDNPRSIVELIDNGENKVVIPYSVIVELDRLKQSPGKSHLVRETVEVLTLLCYNVHEYSDNIIIIRRGDFNYNRENCRDETIIADVKQLLDELKKSDKDIDLSDIIFVSNDQILRLRVLIETNIQVSPYDTQQRFVSDVERYSGFCDENEENLYPKNSFLYKDNKVWSNKDEKFIPDHDLYQLKPKNFFQNAAMHLLKDDNIKVVSIASPAGFGKTILVLAAALEAIQSSKKPETEENFEMPKRRGRRRKIDTELKENHKIKSKYKKIFIVRPTVIIGEDLGFLPGDLDEKIDPYFRPIKDLIYKLHDLRNCGKLFIDGEKKKGFCKEVIEFLPITYIRGMNIENAIVIIDEIQNLTRNQVKNILTRMGDNVRVFLNGDIDQIDHPNLNASNNGLNWVLRKFKDNEEYGHITLHGHKSRGPITDLVLRTGL